MTQIYMMKKMKFINLSDCILIKKIIKNVK